MIIAGYEKNSFVDYPNNISAVVFVGGCNMHCWYCHNENIIDLKNIDQSLILNENEILEDLKKRVGFLDGVVVTGGEPTLQSDLVDFIKKLKTMGYLVKLDTNGKKPEVIKNLIDLKLLDYIAMDVKAPIDKYNELVTPKTVDKAETLKKSIDIIINSGIKHEFRTTVIPQLTKQDIEDIAKTVKNADAYFLQQYRDSLNLGIKPLAKNVLIEYLDIANKYVKTRVRGIWTKILP